MKLLLILQEGYGVQSLDFAPNAMGQQCFFIHEGAGLQAVDFIQDMASKGLKYSNGPETLDHSQLRPHQNALSAPLETLLREQD